jgi:hypothetical protein
VDRRRGHRPAIHKGAHALPRGAYGRGMDGVTRARDLPRLRVEPSQLRHSGQRMRRVAAGLLADLEAARVGLAGAPAGPGAWAVVPAARQAATEWVSLVRDLAGRLDALGRALVTVAESYAGTDARAAARTGRMVAR